MHRKSNYFLAVLAVLILLHSYNVSAAEPSCGASTKDAIAEAENALAAKNDNGQARALACLIEAVKQIRRTDAVCGDGNTVIHFQGASGRKPRTP